jgi:DNA-directed RNA polymerase specialized sigma24 family protein
MVWAGFFPRLAAGGYTLDAPLQLIRLLKTMARNLLLKEVHKLRTIRRGGLAAELTGFPVDTVMDPRPGPSQVVIFKDLRHKARGLLSIRERMIARQRARGRSWPEIAAVCGGRSDALRMEMFRAYKRVVSQLSWDD